MSIIDNSNNTIVNYTSGVTKPFSGQRLMVATYKTGTKKEDISTFGIKRDSRAVSLPIVLASDVHQNLTLLMPHIVSMIAKTQDSIIKGILEENISRLHVGNEEISIAACIEFLDDSDESGRMTKESIGKWFDAEIADPLMLALGEKMGIGEIVSANDAKKIDMMMKQFREKISALAGGKTKYEEKLVIQLKKAVSFAPENDVIAGRFIARLDKMLVPVVEEELLIEDCF